MTPRHTSDPDRIDDELGRTLRRAAEHLARTGTQYLERPAMELTEPRPTAPRSRRRGVLVGVAAASLTGLVAAGAALIDGGSPASRLERLSPATESGEETSADTESTSPADGSALVPDDSTLLDSDGDGSPDGDVVVDRPGDDTVTDPPVITILPPDVTTPGDRVSPVISQVSAPPTVTAGDEFTISWRVVDPDGVSSTGYVIGWSSGIFTPCGFGQSARLVSGTVFDGIWSFPCVMPANAVSTEYTFEVSAQDMLGNWSSAGGFSFTVVGGSSDASPPAHRDVRVVGTVGAGGVLTVAWSLSDASGIDGAVMWVAGPTGGFANANGERYALYETMVVTDNCSAGGTDCDYLQTVQLAPWAPAGTYTLWISATDTLGNKVLESVLQFTVNG